MNDSLELECNSVKTIFESKVFSKAQKKSELGSKRLTFLFGVLMILMVVVCSVILLVNVKASRTHYQVTVTKNDFELLYTLLSKRLDTLEDKLTETQISVQNHLTNHDSTKSQAELFIEQVNKLKKN
jgi:hypothetical protein